MSDFLAEARVIIRPDTTAFRAQLEAELVRATSRPLVVPVRAQVVAGGGGTAAAAASTSELAAAQQLSTTATLELAAAIKVLNAQLAASAAAEAADAAATDADGAAHTRAAGAAGAHAKAQSQVQKAALASTAGMLGLRGAVLTAGTAFIAATVGFQALGKAVGSSIDFERELNVFAVTSGATADQLERVSQVARELGRDITLPGVAANDAAQTLSLLARAGLSVENSLGAVRGTLQLATAAEIDNAKAAELVANSLNAFKLDGDEAAKVADLLAGAAAQSQGSIEDMGLALKQTASIASGLGISIQDTVTILTQLSRAGLSASDAGTSFRQTLLRLIQDLPKVNDEVTALGLNLRDAAGNIRPQVFEELGQKLQKLTPAARQLAVANLGGADAIRTLLILTRAQAGEFDNIEAAITRVGIAQEQAGARTKGLGGDVEGAKNEFADLGLTVGNVASGPLSLLVRTAGQAAGAINDLNSSVEESAGGGGFFHQFGLVVNDLAGSFARLNISFQQGVRLAQGQADRFSALDAAAESASSAVNDLATALERAGKATLKKQGTPQDSGLGVQQVINRITGFDSAEVRARISGDTQSLLDVLNQEQEFLIAQLQRDFVKNRPALQHQLENQLLGVTNDIEAISNQANAAKKSAATRIASTTREADQDLINALSGQRGGVENQIATAQQTTRLSDDLKFQIRLRDLIKKQIKEIAARIKDEQLKTQTIQALKAALIQSKAAIAGLLEQQQQIAVTSIDLDIQLAQTTENSSQEIRKRQSKIKLLQKQLRAEAKEHGKNTVLYKQLRNQIAAERAAIEDLRHETAETSKEAGKTAQQQQFEFLQKQQGFAANLLGNLIPGFATAGLVGNTQPTADAAALGANVQTSAQINRSQELGVRPVQVDTTNALLRQILAALHGRQTQPPEIRNNRRTGSANFDTL